MSEATMTDIETVRDALKPPHRDAQAALSRIERVVEAAKELHVESVEAGGRVRVTRRRYAALREALGALDD